MWEVYRYLLATTYLFFMQDKQNEACYLQEHKEDLIEELATTIVRKVWQAFFTLAYLIAKTRYFNLVSLGSSRKEDNINVGCTQ